jgi:hypothetical protein
MKQELLTLPGHLSSPPVLKKVSIEAGNKDGEKTK